MALILHMLHAASLQLVLVVLGAAVVVDGRPNFVFILADDQDRLLGSYSNRSDSYTSIGSIDVMPTVKTRLIAEGAWFDNYFVNTPICCPSRTEFLTGRYAHNVYVPRGKGLESPTPEGVDPNLVAEATDNEVCMHANTSQVALRDQGLFGLLTSLGYNTGIFGKTTNNQQWMLDRLVQQKSASYIDSPIDYNDYNSPAYYKYDGVQTSVERLNKTAPRFHTTYQTAQIGNRTQLWLSDAIHKAKAGIPFFAYLGFHAPHFPAEPAPWHTNLMADVTVPMTPNYNLSCPKSAQHIRQNPGLSERARCWENRHFRDRWLSLLSVDDVVKAVVDQLEAAGALANTYIIYTSDHGYKQGQWRIGTSKQHPYETDIRIPFIMRGPGIQAGANISAVSANVDLLPTLVELAGGKASIPDDVDGRSLVALLRSAESKEAIPWRDRIINEYWSVGTYYNDHSQVWDDGSALEQCGGVMPNSPQGHIPASQCKESTHVGKGNCYFVDSTLSNSWRALRVLNRTHNFQYVEYDPAWMFAENATLQHYEYYDLRRDPYQLSNVHDQLDVQIKATLHAEMLAYYSCRGASCPPKLQSIEYVVI